MTCAIPKKLSHIWIGPKKPPIEWMNTWRQLHPDWEYTLYDNDFLFNRKFQTQSQINEYLKRRQYAGVADLMRLEILYEHGGFMPGADSICIRNMTALFSRAHAYTIYENEAVRGDLVSPIQACEPGNKFVKKLIDKLSETNISELDEPWISTGNLFTAQMIKSENPEITIFPSHYMIPIHYTGICYEGDGPIYAIQKFGSTPNEYQKEGYNSTPLLFRALDYFAKRKAKILNKNAISSIRKRRIESVMKKIHTIK
ncbi:MAG: glycosyltransferase [Burkholderiaceae bacterium]